MQQQKERLFSQASDSCATKEEYTNCAPGTVPLLFDLYDDGTKLFSSGSQSMHVLRIRIVSMRGVGEWEDIGFPPGLDVGEKTGVSKERIKMAKLEMEHLLLYLVQKDILDGSRTGMTVYNCIVSPRLHIVVVDLP